MNEKIKYTDEKEYEFEVYRLGFRKALQIARKHIPINEVRFNTDNSYSIKGDIDIIGLKASCLETINGLDLDKMLPEEADRIYSKYFEKDIMRGMGKGGSPK